MSIFPILAAAAPAFFLSPGSASHGASGDNIDFYHVLQQMGSGASASASSGAEVTLAELFSFPKSSAEAVPADDKAAILRPVAAPPSGPSAATSATGENAVSTNFLAACCARNAEPDAPGILPGAETRNAKTAGQSVLLHAKDDLKKAGAEASFTGEQAQPNAGATPALVPPVAVATPCQASPLAATLASAESVAISQQASGATPAKIPWNQLFGISSESAASTANVAGRASANALSAQAVPNSRVSPAPGDSATVGPSEASASSEKSSLAADRASVASDSASASALAAEVQASTGFAPAQSMLAALRAETATCAAFSTIAALGEVKAKAKPQAAISSGKAGGAAELATGFGTASALQTSPQVANLDPSLAPEDFAQGTFPVDHSMFRSGADSSSRQPKTRSRSETASQGDSLSATAEKSAGPGGEHDANARPTAEGSAHAFSFQFAVPPPSAPAPVAADATQSAASSAATVLPQPTQVAAGAAVPPQPHFHSHPLPDPHCVVDSGQLRVGQNSSELKVSVQLPELGKVEVRAVTSHDVTTAHLTASHRDALQVLSADRTGLEQALKSRDVILGSLDSHGQRHAAGQQRQPNSQSSAQSSGGTSPTAAVVTTSATEEAGSSGFLPDYSSISVRV